MKERIVCIEWDDASFSSGYYNKKQPEDFDLVKVKTVGLVVKDTKEAITLSTDRYYDNYERVEDDRHISTIPKKMIRRIIDLKESK